MIRLFKSVFVFFALSLAVVFPAMAELEHHLAGGLEG